MVVGNFVALCVIRFEWQGAWVECHAGSPTLEYATLSGLVVDKRVTEQYQRLSTLLDAALRPDQTVLAGPDSPDVYFFTGRRNPTPVMYDIFVAPDRHAVTLHRLAECDDIGAVIFNMVPEFSQPWSEEVGRLLVHRMRRQMQIGKFMVYYNRAD